MTATATARYSRKYLSASSGLTTAQPRKNSREFSVLPTKRSKPRKMLTLKNGSSTLTSRRRRTSMPIIDDLIQGSPEWLQMRCGCATSSRLNDALDKLKDPKKESAARARYRKELMIERLTGRSTPHFVSEAMMWGTEWEGKARVEYEQKTGNDVSQIGLALHPEIKWF